MKEHVDGIWALIDDRLPNLPAILFGLASGAVAALALGFVLLVFAPRALVAAMYLGQALAGATAAYSVARRRTRGSVRRIIAQAMIVAVVVAGGSWLALIDLAPRMPFARPGALDLVFFSVAAAAGALAGVRLRLRYEDLTREQAGS